MPRDRHLSVLVAITSALACTAAPAQTWPSKPVRVIVPFPPGGGTDVIGRVLSQRFSAAFGQQFVVDNRAGAAGRIGTEAAARALPDGYTLLFTTTSTIITPPALFPKLPYDSIRDFAPIGPIASGAMVLIVHPSVNARSVRDLIGIAKRAPGELNFASTGPGDTNHLAAEFFQRQAGVRMTHVPYKGAAPATLSVVTGETSLMFSNIVPALPALKSHRVVPLGITSLERSPLIPEIAPIAQQGLRGFEVENLYFLLAPANTAPDIISRLNAEMRKATADPEIRKRLELDGSRVVSSTPEELRNTISVEIAKWTKLVKAAGIHAQ
jgi:tripartite-type tricarboxylate transporter receptor subunit TctC